MRRLKVRAQSPLALREHCYGKPDSTFPRRGRRTSSPPQFGQILDMSPVQGAQKVHS